MHDQLVLLLKSLAALIAAGLLTSLFGGRHASLRLAVLPTYAVFTAFLQLLCCSVWLRFPFRKIMCVFPIRVFRNYMASRYDFRL